MRGNELRSSGKRVVIAALFSISLLFNKCLVAEKSGLFEDEGLLLQLISSGSQSVFYNKVFVANYTDNSVSVIDGETNTVEQVITGIETPYDIAINQTTKKVYVSSLTGQTIYVVDGITNQIFVNGISIPVSGPKGLDINEGTNRLYIASADGGPPAASDLSILNTETDSFFTNVSLTSYSNEGYAVAMNSNTNIVYTACLSGEVVISNGSDLSFIADLNSLTDARGILVDEGGNFVYATNEFGAPAGLLQRIDPKAGNATFDQNLSSCTPYGIAYNQSSGVLFASCTNTNYAYINTADFTTPGTAVEVPIASGSSQDIALNQYTGMVYIAHNLDPLSASKVVASIRGKKWENTAKI